MSKDVNDIPVPSIDLSIIMDRNVAAVWVHYEDVEHFEVIGAVGSAKRHPGDVYDATIALELATSRALRALSGKLLRRANSKVAEADAKRAAVERANEAPKPPRLNRQEWESLKTQRAKLDTQKTKMQVARASGGGKKAPRKKDKKK